MYEGANMSDCNRYFVAKARPVALKRRFEVNLNTLHQLSCKRSAPAISMLFCTDCAAAQTSMMQKEFRSSVKNLDGQLKAAGKDVCMRVCVAVRVCACMRACAYTRE